MAIKNLPTVQGRQRKVKYSLFRLQQIELFDRCSPPKRGETLQHCETVLLLCV